MSPDSLLSGSLLSSLSRNRRLNVLSKGPIPTSDPPTAAPTTLVGTEGSDVSVYTVEVFSLRSLCMKVIP